MGRIRIILEHHDATKDLVRLLPEGESLICALLFAALVVQCGILAGELTEEIVAIVCFSYAMRQVAVSRARRRIVP